MSKFKLFISLFLSLIFVLRTSTIEVKAATIPGTNYEMVSSLSVYDSVRNE